MSYAMYLRKSRQDPQAESDTETLERHERALTELATLRKLNVIKIYKEVISGESVSARPEMLKLLKEIEAGLYEGVLVVELERLGRGNSQDQGKIMDAFQISKTLIVTPYKTYDFSNSMDETYGEFGFFMSRQEYKTTNRRLQRGRRASVQEGKFIGSIPAFGYQRLKLKKGYTLEPHPNEFPIVQQIFDWFVQSNLGASVIANKLNDIKVPTRKGDVWTYQTILTILSNPVYIGKIRYDWRKTERIIQGGKTKKIRPRHTDYILVEGLHKSIIEETAFSKAQERLKQNSAPKTKKDKTLKNPLANIIKCGNCGRVMIRRPYSNREPALICTCKTCKTVSSDLALVEKALISRLDIWLKNYILRIKKKSSRSNEEDIKKKSITNLNQELETVNKQIHSLCDLLEKGIYDISLFQERNKKLHEKKKELEASISTLSNNISNKQNEEETALKYTKIIELYKNAKNAEAKNFLLSKVLEKVEYIKEKSGRWADPNDFHLKIYPRI